MSLRCSGSQNISTGSRKGRGRIRPVPCWLLGISTRSKAQERYLTIRHSQSQSTRGRYTVMTKAHDTLLRGCHAVKWMSLLYPLTWLGHELVKRMCPPVECQLPVAAIANALQVPSAVCPVVGTTILQVGRSPN
jgi:hypothetical protein